MPQIDNAYVRFFKSVSDSIKEENPELKNDQIVSKIAQRWKNMDSEKRKPFEDAAQKDVDAENERIATIAAKRASTLADNKKKVYVVFSIETCDSGENFTMERVFSSSKGIEAYKYKFESDFKYNTETHPDKDKTEWESELNALLPQLKKETVLDTSKKLDTLMCKFTTNKKDKNAFDLPCSRTHVKIMTVDKNDDSEKKSYDYC